MTCSACDAQNVKLWALPDEPDKPLCFWCAEGDKETSDFRLGLGDDVHGYKPVSGRPWHPLAPAQPEPAGLYMVYLKPDEDKADQLFLKTYATEPRGTWPIAPSVWFMYSMTPFERLVRAAENFPGHALVSRLDPRLLRGRHLINFWVWVADTTRNRELLRRPDQGSGVVGAGALLR